MSLNKRLINTTGAGGGGGTACDLDILGDGSCIALYQLDGDVTDLSGNYNGTPTGSITYGAGVYDQAAVFPTTTAGWQTALSLGGSQTYSLWINVDLSAFNTYKLLFWNNDNTFRFFSYAPNELFFNVGSTSIMLPYASFNNAWHHFVLVVNNNSSIQMYVNGNLYDSAAIGSVPTYTFMDFGKNRRSSLWYAAPGSIDQVRVFNRALNSTEAGILYNETVCN